MQLCKFCLQNPLKMDGAGKRVLICIQLLTQTTSYRKSTFLKIFLK